MLFFYHLVTWDFWPIKLEKVHFSLYKRGLRPKKKCTIWFSGQKYINKFRPIKIEKGNSIRSLRPKKCTIRFSGWKIHWKMLAWFFHNDFIIFCWWLNNLFERTKKSNKLNLQTAFRLDVYRFLKKLQVGFCCLTQKATF